MNTESKYHWQISNPTTNEVLAISPAYQSSDQATKAAKQYAHGNIDPNTRITITVLDENQKARNEIKDVTPRSLKNTQRASGWHIVIGCLAALAILWINDLLCALRSPKPAQLGLTQFEAIEMVVVVLFFITVLSLFPALIFFAFDLEGKSHAKNRIKDQLEREKLDFVIDDVDRAFESAYDTGKYRLPVILVTIAMMLGWAFFFFSNGPDAVWELARSRNLAQFFSSVGSLHPVVFGFIGAFFFSLQTLVRRYFTADLKPSVFMHIAVRIWLVMILSLILALVVQTVPVTDGSASNEGATPAALIAVCFIAGIVPDIALDLIKKAAKTLTGKILPFASDSDPSMTKIQGLNMWHQVRLAEEGIENVQNLAESDILDLIVYTRLGVRRLLDWIDQSLLYIHTGEDDFKKYQDAGIHTATELVKVYEICIKSTIGSQQNLPTPANMFMHSTTITEDMNYKKLVKLQKSISRTAATNDTAR